MKRFWFKNLAIALGLVGASPLFAQYPAYNTNTNTGPSAYPVQQPTGYQLTNWQDSVPSVPSGTYGNAPVQGFPQPGQPGQPGVTPLPMAPHHAAPTYAQPSQPPMAYSQPAPTMSYSQQAIAPGCASCGDAPVSQGYAPNYGAASCGPAPYAYSAPSIGYGYSNGSCGPNYCSPAPRRHFGNGLPTGAKPYFFGGGVLIFKRIDDYNRTLTINDTAAAGVLYTQDAEMPTMAGFEVMGGRYFNCGKNAIVASYWGLFPENQMVAVTDGGNGLRSTLFRPWAAPAAPNTGEYQLQTGVAADPVTDPDVYGLYDTATTHRLRRSSSYNNVEINLLGFAVGGAARNFNRSTAGTMFSGTRHRHGAGGYGDCGQSNCGGCYEEQYGCSACGNSGCGECCGEDSSRYATGPCGYVAPSCGSRLNVSWLAGVRYLQFNDNLEYAAYGGPSLGTTTLSYDLAARNSLVGFQVGGRADYCLGCRANLYSLAKAGIYGNNASLQSRLGTELYNAYASNDPTMAFNFSRSKNQLAFMSEIGAGVGYRFSPKWTATCGYRAIVASGVATAVGNIRHQGQTISGTGIRAQDYLVLHGLNIGALYNF